MTDAEFLRALKTCTLASLSHADHIRATWIVLQQEPLPRAINTLSTMFLDYAASKGHPEYFHTTITWAFVAAINERMILTGPCATWRDFLAAHDDLSSGTDFLRRWYSSKRLDSELARQHFVLPD